MNLELPEAIRALTKGLTLKQNALGETNASLFRAGDEYYLKIQPTAPTEIRLFEPLSHDANVLRWLDAFVPVPKVVCFESDAENDYLLMTRLPGLPACELAAPPLAIARAYGLALRQFHEALPVDACPFDERLSVKLNEIDRRAKHGLVELDNLDDARVGWTTEQLLAEVSATTPSSEDLVVTHGDYCLPNVVFEEDLRLSGFIDIGACGIADRHFDLALGVRSIERNLGNEWGDVFLDAYGCREVQRDLIEFYQLLDEFF